MTDKEKVLRVWPDTIVYGNKILWKWLWYRESDPDKISGQFDTEEAAWQNAAEYLPAQPEHCSGCLHPDGHNGETHCYGTIEHPDQSAPLEPTRGNACPGCGDSESGCDQAGCWKTGILYAAEPKPQPDSSSISNEQKPEQIISDETLEDWVQSSGSYLNAGYAKSVIRELQQWRKWAKASEPKKTEG